MPSGPAGSSAFDCRHRWGRKGSRVNRRVSWDALPTAVRHRIEAEAGAFVRKEQVATGHNCLVGMILHTTGTPTCPQARSTWLRWQRPCAPGRGVGVVSERVAHLGLASLVCGSEQFEPAHASDRPQARQGGAEESGGAFVLLVGGRIGCTLFADIDDPL
jgi:hypothetical protein